MNKRKQQEKYDCKLGIAIYLRAKKLYWYLGLMQSKRYEQKLKVINKVRLFLDRVTRYIAMRQNRSRNADLKKKKGILKG